MNLPDYNFLSAPLWLITALHILTLTLHFVAMNFLVGGVIIVLWGKFTNRWEHPTVRRFVGLFPTAMAATVTFGVAPLLFLQLVYHRQVYSAAIVSGWFWLMIIPVVIVAYYLLYSASLSRVSGAGRKGLYLLLALAGMVYVSLVYSSVFSMTERPDLIQSLYSANQSGLVWNPNVGDYLLRWLHMVLGAVTVGGFFIGWLGSGNEEAFKVGRNFFLWGMVLAAVAGFAYLMSLAEYMVQLMHTPAIWALTIGILLSAGSLHFFFKRKFNASAAMLFVSMITMVLTRHYVRLLKLNGAFEPSSLRVAPQWSPFIMFLICFVAAIGVVWYMLSLFFGKKKASA